MHGQHGVEYIVQDRAWGEHGQAQVRLIGFTSRPEYEGYWVTATGNDWTLLMQAPLVEDYQESMVTQSEWEEYRQATHAVRVADQLEAELIGKAVWQQLLLKDNKFVMAIKAYRELHQCSLKLAKDAVEDYRDQTPMQRRNLKIGDEVILIGGRHGTMPGQRGVIVADDGDASPMIKTSPCCYSNVKCDGGYQHGGYFNLEYVRKPEPVRATCVQDLRILRDLIREIDSKIAVAAKGLRELHEAREAYAASLEAEGLQLVTV